MPFSALRLCVRLLKDPAMDCVAGYHLNTMQCGIAKFNKNLAGQLGLPFFSVLDERLAHYREPLLSVRATEFTDEDAARFEAMLDELAAPDRTLHVFLHGYEDTPLERRLVRAATTVLCANAEMLARVRERRPDAVESWCPGMIESHDRFDPTEISIFTFGMAHKVKSRQYLRLKRLLDETRRSYALYVSSALHEGTSFDEGFSAAFDEIRSIFDGRAHFLGYLSDAGVYNWLTSSTYFVAFFDGGVRANNTSVNAAMDAGCAVITNLDAYSPSAYRHLETVIDVNEATELVTDAERLEGLRGRAQAAVRDTLSWDGLARVLRAACV